MKSIRNIPRKSKQTKVVLVFVPGPALGAPGTLLKRLIDPVLEGVRLYPDPDLLLALDVHALGGVTLGTPGLQHLPRYARSKNLC